MVQLRQSAYIAETLHPVESAYRIRQVDMNFSGAEDLSTKDFWSIVFGINSTDAPGLAERLQAYMGGEYSPDRLTVAAVKRGEMTNPVHEMMVSCSRVKPSMRIGDNSLFIKAINPTGELSDIVGVAVQSREVVFDDVPHFDSPVGRLGSFTVFRASRAFFEPGALSSSIEDPLLTDAERAVMALFATNYSKSTD